MNKNFSLLFGGKTPMDVQQAEIKAWNAQVDARKKAKRNEPKMEKAKTVLLGRHRVPTVERYSNEEALLKEREMTAHEKKESRKHRGY